MKSHLYLSLLFLAQAASAQQAQEFQVRGTVKEVRPEQRQLVVRHDEIKNYMDAMTMPFAVKDLAEIREVRPGDIVTFTLHVQGDEEWIGALRVEQHGKASPSPKPLSPAKIGQPLPDVQLVGIDGKPFSIKGLLGHPVALTFIFTRCPLPDMCPLLSTKFAAASKKLPKNARLLSVSIDPEHDTPEVLSKYAGHYGAGSQQWLMATGPVKEVTQLAIACGADFWEENGFINHNLRTVVLDADGRLLRIWTDQKWQAEDLIAELERASSPASKAEP